MSSFAQLTEPARAPVHESAQVRTSPRYQLDPLTDTVLLSSMSILTLGMEVIIAGGDLGGAAVGSSDDLFVLDRPVAEMTAPVSGMSDLSNIGMLALFGVEAFRFVRVGIEDDWESSLVETTLVLESAMLAAMLTNLTKLAVRRPRPVVYGAGRDSASTDESVSFISGHAAVAAAIAATSIYLVWDRAPGSAEAWLLTASASLLTVGVSIARVLALRHFPTDVVAGAVTGGAAGLLVPHLHRANGRDIAIGVSVGGESQAGLQIRGVF